ncbi:MAG: response regulator [Candidatus Brocadiaceae bacterium]|nr:response regulator [Candidatus Brocadiaceae bacterium]
MTKPRLLLVDDDTNTLDGMVRVMKHYGFPVSGVFSGTEALDLLSKKEFDIIITDMKLQEMGGLTLIREIRKKNEHIAIVVITSYSSVKTALDAKKCGANDYLTKPVNIEELVQVIEKLWKKQQPADMTED